VRLATNDSEELVRNSGLLASVLIEVGTDHRLAEPEPLERMLRACERAAAAPNPLPRTPPSFQNGEMPPLFLIDLTVRYELR
jgi:hypothetical protein